MRKYAPDWLTLLSASLIVFAFPPWDIAPLIWICLIPWFAALKRARNQKEAFAQGVWLSFFMSVGGFFWVASVLHEFGELPWALSVLGLILYSLGGQPQFLVFGALYKWIQERIAKSGKGWDSGLKTLALTLVLGALYTGIDWLIPKLFVDTLGHSLYKARHLRQVADLAGAQYLTFLIFVVNDVASQCLRRVRARHEPSFWPVMSSSGLQTVFVAVLFAATWTYGFFRNREILDIMRANQSKGFQAAVIQANIGDFEKFASEHGIGGAANRILQTFFTMSDQALEMTPKPQVLIWPETSYPSTFGTPETSDELMRDQSVERFVAERRTPLLFGGYDQKDHKDYNAFFLLSPKLDAPPTEMSPEGDLQVYRKNMLLLFGEYIPGSDEIDFLKHAFPQVGNFGRGPGPEVYAVKPAGDATPVNIGPVICYEALFPNYVIAAARKGSQLILNITNDSWFGTWGEPQLHFSLITFRSVETRLPQLRATNTGISALITPDGAIQQATAIYRPEIMNVRVPLIPPVWTLLKIWGDWFGWVSLLAGVAGLFAILRACPRRMTG